MREVRALEAAYYELGIKNLLIITDNLHDQIQISADTTIEVVPFYAWALR
jgi:hypothetical protein